MSYILDALSKSQRERERAIVPTLTTEFPAQASKRRPQKTLVLASIGLLTIGVLLAAFGLSGRASGPHVSRQVMVATAQPSPPPTTTAPPSTTISVPLERIEITNLDVEASPLALASDTQPRRKPTAPEPAQENRAADNDQPRKERSDIAESVHVASAPEASQGVLSDRRLSPATRWLVKEMAAMEQDAQRKAVSKQESGVQAAQADDLSVASIAAGSDSIRQPPLPEPVAEMPDQRISSGTDLPSQPTDEVPAFANLPPETRSTMPALEVNVHTYAQTREGRMVFINMKRYGEGDRLAEGPVIDAITPTGVVLVHEQRRFHLPAR